MSGHESEYSNLESMSPHSRGSASSSPSQQVPHLTHVLQRHSVSCGPFLRVIEQPSHNFRFRYKSEMVGTHGCILGRSSGSKSKTHPAVELVNHVGPALIRVRLVQADSDEEHPHKLLLDDEEDCDVTATLQCGSYRVAFPGMGIIHTAKKNVPSLLFTKLMKTTKDPDVLSIRSHCEYAAKAINLNKVRLMFSAHDVQTNRDICEPVFSDVINNMKSASTNDLKICRISRANGWARGGDDVYLLVEKVNKKNIMVRFYELDEYDEEVWSAQGNFLQSDVHHQYAIVIRTPQYRDPQISSDVRVYIELVRPTDGRTSEPKEFVYKADQVFKNKKRRINSSLSSIGSGSGGSINSLNDLPIPVRMMTQNNEPDVNQMMFKLEIPQLPIQVEGTNDDLAEALLSGAGCGGGGGGVAQPALSQMLAQPAVSEPPLIQINSSEFQRLLHHDKDMSIEDKNKISQADISEYLKFFSDSLNEKNRSMDFMSRSMELLADSGTGKLPEVKVEVDVTNACEDNGGVKHNMLEQLKGVEYKAQYKAEDGQEVKKLVKEICEIIKSKEGFKKQVVCSKLERLMKIRLSNGDTFLHMTLSSNQPSFEYIVRLIHSMRLPHLLNLTNSLGQTILHLAVVNDLPTTVPMLVSKGCCPLAADHEGNTPLHYAVICRSCLEPLLSAARQLTPPVDINVYNHEKQSPLHVAALYDVSEAARLLLAAGAQHECRDREGRTPLHLAVYDDHYDVTEALIHFIPTNEIDAVDGSGNTALQIVCGVADLRKNTLRILQLLLDKQADPLKLCGLVRHEAVRNVLRLRRPELSLADGEDDSGAGDIEVKSEPDDDFESADEGVRPIQSESEECGLPLLPMFTEEVSALLAAGGWRRLAQRLHGERLVERCEQAAHPAATLLAHLQDPSEGLTYKSLAMHLKEIGEIEAANIVRKYIY